MEITEVTNEEAKPQSAVAIPDATKAVADLTIRLAEWEKSQAGPFRALAAEAKAITVAGHIDGEDAGYIEADAMRLRLKNARLALEGSKAILAPLKTDVKRFLGRISDAEVHLVQIIAPEEDRLADEVQAYNDKRLTRRQEQAQEAGVSPDLKILRDGAESTWAKHLAKLIEDKRVADEAAALELARNDLRDARIAQARELGASLDDIGDIYAIPDISEDEWAAKAMTWKTAKDTREAQEAADNAERARLEQENRERIAEQERQREQIREQKAALRRAREQTLDAIWPGWRANDPGFRFEDASEESMAAYIETVKDARDAERVRDIRAARAEILDDIDRDHLPVSVDLGTITDDEFDEIKQAAKDAKKDRDDQAKRQAAADAAAAHARREAARPGLLRAAEYADAVAKAILDVPFPQGLPSALEADLIRMREDAISIATESSKQNKEKA